MTIRDSSDPRNTAILAMSSGSPARRSSVCEITRWPEHAGETPTGRVREALGTPGDLEVEVPVTSRDELGRRVLTVPDLGEILRREQRG